MKLVGAWCRISSGPICFYSYPAVTQPYQPWSFAWSAFKKRILILHRIFCKINSELLMCRKIGCNRNVRSRVNKTEFGWIVLNLIFYFGSKTKIKVVDITYFFSVFLH
jgi:hypothetical protein